MARLDFPFGDNTSELRRIKEWLSRGRPMDFKERRVKNPQGERIMTVVQPQHIVPLVWLLREEVPESPLVVVVDGEWNLFVELLCGHIAVESNGSRFGIVKYGECPQVPGLMGVTFNASDVNHIFFLGNLVTDIVIIPPQPEILYRERILRWVGRTAYIVLAEG